MNLQPPPRRPAWPVRLARAVWAGLWLAILLAGVPVALVRYGGHVLAAGWPGRWQQVAHQPITLPTLAAAAIVLAWVVWTLLVYTFLVETGRRVRRTRVTRWRLPGLPNPVQAAAAGLLGATVFAATPATAGPPPAVAPAAAGSSREALRRDVLDAAITLAAAQPDARARAALLRQAARVDPINEHARAYATGGPH